MYLVKKYATKILSNSIAALDFFYFDRDKNDKQFEVIYNGIDSYQFLVTKESLRSELKIPDTAFVAGHVGRFTEAKNHKTIIEVAIKLCRVNPNNFFILCGKDTDINLKVRIEREGLQKQIKLLGLRNDVIKVLNTLNCFYFPSLTEGQPNALIEALITGLPFVASNIDPVKETIPLAYHTQLIEPLDIELAVDKILKIKYDAGFARSLNLRDCAVSNYNPDVLFKKFFDKL
jgi:glycosyltransferase involved in cell wall biosynthesis